MTVHGDHDTASLWGQAGRDDGTPLVAIHTWRGESAHYEDLAAAMDGHRIYSILPPDPQKGLAPRRVEQWVDHHEAVLPMLPITEPYSLLGWSFGGVVALELARRLRKRGATVTFVGMIDTIRPRLLPLSTREFIWYHLATAAAMPERARMAYMRQKGLFLLYRRFPRLGSSTRSLLIRLGYRRGRAVKQSVKPTDPLQMAVHTSYLNYRGDPVPFPVSIYATETSVERAPEPALRWGPWLRGGYEWVVIPGEHATVFDPHHIRELGAAVKASLVRARASQEAD